jgi:hypothetical protein
MALADAEANDHWGGIRIYRREKGIKGTFC